MLSPGVCVWYPMAGQHTQWTRTVSALRAWRRAEVSSTGAGGNDSTLLGLVADPFTDVGDASARLAALERCLYGRGDGRASFLTVYARVTTEVERGILDGAFEDPAWVADYLVTFADHYRAAFAAYERGDLDDVPGPWRLSFGAALGDETLVLQDVLLGVNAHVNYDLALTLTSVGIGPDRRSRRADHRAINEVLDRLVDVQQDRLAARYARGIADLDAACGRVDEWGSSFALRQGRRAAWYEALALTRAPSSLAQHGFERVLDATATAVGYAILAPLVDPAVRDALRTVETGDHWDDPTDARWQRLLRYVTGRNER